MSIRFETSGWRAPISDECSLALVAGEKWSGGEAEPATTSSLVNSAGGSRSLAVSDIPNGFPHIGALINEDKIILGGDQPALFIKDYYPEKDGMPACLLAAKTVAAHGASLTERLTAVYQRTEALDAARIIDVRFRPQLKASLSGKLQQHPDNISSRTIKEINRIDGVEFLLADGSWLPMRASETELLAPIYAESESTDDLEVLLEQGRKHLLG